MENKRNNYKKKEKVVIFLVGLFVFCIFIVYLGLYFMGIGFGNAVVKTGSSILELKKEMIKRKMIDTISLDENNGQ